MTVVVTRRPATAPKFSKRAEVIKILKHQAISLKHNDITPIVYDTSDCGTGKTFVRIKAFEKRHKVKKAKKMLVIAPKSLLYSAWGADLRKFAPHLRFSIASAENREAAFQEDADVYITNVDAAVWLVKQKKVFWKDFDELVIDESTAFKHHTSKRSKAMRKIAKFFKYRAALTATPNGNTICDVWHQALLLDDGKRLGTEFYAFRNTVCEPMQVGRNERAIAWMDKDGAEEAVFGLLADIVIRHKLDECADIPALHQYTVPYQLSTKQKQAYLTMEIAKVLPMIQGVKITAVHAASVMTKLLQIASGAVYHSEDKYEVIDDGRYKLVLDLVEARQHSLCFYLWKHQRDLMAAEAAKRGLEFCIFEGSDSEKAAMVRMYQAGKYQVMFGHPKSLAHGHTLTRGTTTIWPSPTSDLEQFKQGSSRQRRLGQTKKTENIIVVAEGTHDERAYERLIAKDGRMSNLLDLFNSIKVDNGWV